MSEEPKTSLRDLLTRAVEAGAAKQTDWLRKLASFPSTRGHEAACQDWLAGEFAARGWSVDRYALSEVAIDHLPGYSPVFAADYSKAIQVVATLRAKVKTGRSLILQGHIDVVPPGPVEPWAHEPFEPQVKDGFMTGRGVFDMKAGVAEMVFALDALRAVGLRPTADVFVETVSEEECTGNGALSTLARGYVADACLIPEAVNGQLLRAQLGSVWFRLRVAERAAHVLETELGENAILRAYGQIAALERLAAATSETAKGSKWFGQMPNPIKFSVGKIKGGDWVGMVPSWCEIDCRVGVLPGQKLADVREAIVRTVSECAAAQNGAAPEIEWIGFQAEPYVLEPGGEAETALADAHQIATGEALASFSMPATSDIRHYGLYYGIPGLCYGGKGSRLHSDNERVSLADMLTTTLVIALFIVNWCGVEPIDADAGGP